MFCLRIYDFLKFCAVHLSEPNRQNRFQIGSKLFCSGSGSVLANELRFWFSVLKKWSENRTEPNFGNTTSALLFLVPPGPPYPHTSGALYPRTLDLGILILHTPPLHPSVLPHSFIPGIQTICPFENEFSGSLLPPPSPKKKDVVWGRQMGRKQWLNILQLIEEFAIQCP